MTLRIAAFPATCRAARILDMRHTKYRFLKMTFDHPDGEASRARDDIMHSPAPGNSFMLKRPTTHHGGSMAAKGRIDIDAEHCKGCELCTSVCPQDVIKMSDWFNAKGYRPAALVDPNGECTGCAVCAVICPDAVITVYRTVTGRTPVAALA
jgi:2-oxoglutarate ferredoxin oxidoreductase subunit delta